MARNLENKLVSKCGAKHIFERALQQQTEQRHLIIVQLQKAVVEVLVVKGSRSGVRKILIFRVYAIKWRIRFWQEIFAWPHFKEKILSGIFLRILFILFFYIKLIIRKINKTNLNCKKFKIIILNTMNWIENSKLIIKKHFRLKLTNNR